MQVFAVGRMLARCRGPSGRWRLWGALAIQILTTFVRKSEQEFMDACSEYCVRHIVNRLRIMPYQSNVE